VGETPDQVAFIAAIPVFNDWAAARLLLSKLETALRAANLRVQVILIDDGSTVPAELDFRELNLEAVCSIEVLLLRRNLGHQRAIAIGLTYAHHQTKDLPILVMDADGEDSPGDVPSLYRKFQEELGQKVIFAKRSKRSESLGFRVFYQIYKLTYRMLTGFDVNVGNFSIAPAIAVDRLVVVSELWSHYAAAVHKARIPYATIDTKRDKRLDGESRMNFVALVIHGLSAISVFSDVVGVRLLATSCLFTLFTLAGILSAISIRLFTDLAIPGWATNTVGILLLALLQSSALSLVFVFIILSARTGNAFLPIRDYEFYCRGSQRGILR